MTCRRARTSPSTRAQAEGLARRIKQAAEGRFAPLTQLCGINLLKAGALAGTLGRGLHTVTDAQVVAYARVARRARHARCSLRGTLRDLVGDR
jgi:hypothetical protein